MTGPRLSGRGIAYAASALIHAGVVVALLPSLTGSAAPTPAETPMAVEMAGFGTPAEPVDMAEPIDTAQAVPTETVQAEPVETAEDVPVETVVEEPPPPAEAPVTETAETEPPEAVPEEPPPEVVTTTGQTEAVVAAVPETVQAKEPEMVQPPPTRPKLRAERRPRREQPRRAEQPEAAPTQQAALPQKPVVQPPAASSASSAQAASYQNRLVSYIQQRLNRANIRVRQDTTITVRFTLQPDGSLENPSLVVSSESGNVDDNVLRVLRRLSAPEPPEGFPRQITAPFLIQAR
ncbi:energy transducer TonB family protein [Inquilinus limosus]|uniref:energy transducer TonB family protein n=1 Tax=Inquilinus limosus TaxID=171674 RepID=UPI0003F55253|nr:energy transducer TonB [Inquilinus limosus]